MPSPLPSDREALVLRLLAEQGDLYGLQLVAESRHALKRGTVYVTLSRMEEKGLIRALEDREPSGHAGLPRPRYRITAQGRRALGACDLVRAALRPQGSRA
jgi:DNA-binding PadR family transcriptional regulator